MAMHQIPTLILGIGGIGCRIAANISDLLTPEARDRVALVGIDTNVNDLSALSERGIRTIQTSDKRSVGEYLQHRPQYRPWFPLNQFTASKTLLNGAGQIRAVSRLGALAAEERGAFDTLKSEIQRIRANRGDESNGSLTVMVVGSITGGTGAGLFLQIPFYIRKLMSGDAGLSNIIIRGMFVGPDLTVGVQPSRINRNAVRTNAYACIKELNAMYRRQLPGVDLDHLKVDFYTPRSKADQHRLVQDMEENWDGDEEFENDYSHTDNRADADIIARGNPEIPYDYLYLIEGSNSDGSIGNAPISSVESLTARMVHTLMFTPVINNALSVEDNMILQDAHHNGMNRYSSAGMSTLVYPQSLAREYVTLCTVRDLVRNEWMVIDDAFHDLVAQARSLQRTDGKTVIPQLKNAFPNIFHKQVKGQGRLGKLYHEAFVVTEHNDEISRSTTYLEGISELIREVVQRDTIKAAAAECSMQENKMKSFDEAIKETNRIYDALENYEKVAKQAAVDNPAAIANELFPPSTQSMNQNRENNRNICKLLQNVHPITARFLCYDMIQQLEARISKLESTLEGMKLDDYLNKDYDPKEPGTQTPAEALRKIEDKQIPILSAFTSDAKKFKSVKTQLQTRTKAQTGLITQYLTDSLDLAVSRILLERTEALAENYSIFFKNIGTMILENNDRINTLENLEMPLGQVGVYCSKDAFRCINSEFQTTVDSELPPETKTAIFDKLFEILAKDFDDRSKVMTEFQKSAAAAERSKALTDTFRKAVVDTIRTSVIRKGTGIVDLNIMQALERQYALKETADSRELEYPAYLRALINRAMKRAAPLMSTTNNATVNNTATAYLALHPACAATELGEPSTGATEALLAPVATDETGGVLPTALLDTAFSPYEIICFRAKYKFSVEDLTKYSYDSENAHAYRVRISNLGKVPVNTGNPDDALTVINPHLDRNWHEEAYLPALYKSERKRDQLDTYKAFLYALGLDLFQRITDEDLLDDKGNGRILWHYQHKGSWHPVTIRNTFIGNSFNELFRSLSYNRRIKKYLLAEARKSMYDRKGYYLADELQERIMDDPFIKDLIGVNTSVTEDQNILNIILQMRNGMKHEDWKMLFTGLLEVLWEYCGFLFDKSERLVNRSVRDILARIYASSILGSKEESSMTFTEREAKGQMDQLRDAIYHQ